MDNIQTLKLKWVNKKEKEVNLIIKIKIKNHIVII
jgi:hypothetical protein